MSLKCVQHFDRAVTAWAQFLPSPTHELCLCCSAMSGLMKLACLTILQGKSLESARLWQLC